MCYIQSVGLSLWLFPYLRMPWEAQQWGRTPVYHVCAASKSQLWDLLVEGVSANYPETAFIWLFHLPLSPTPFG